MASPQSRSLLIHDAVTSLICITKQKCTQTVNKMTMVYLCTISRLDVFSVAMCVVSVLYVPGIGQGYVVVLVFRFDIDIVLMVVVSVYEGGL